MSALAQLPADQQAVLDLVLKRGRSYAGIAGALRLDVDAVRARARAAVCALGSSARSVPPERQAQITDWLLGQADPRTADDAVAYLSSSRAARSWARSAVEGLGPLAEGRLPLLPVPAPARRAERAERRPWPPAAGLAAVAIPSLLVFAVAIVVGSRDEPRVPARSEPAPPSAWLTAAQQRGSARDADGAAEVLSRGARQSLVVTAGGLPRSTGTAAYTVWLTRGTGSAATYVATLRTDAEGRIDGLAPLRVDPARYSEVLVARQRSAGTPTRPGLVVLRGPLR